MFGDLGVLSLPFLPPFPFSFHLHLHFLFFSFFFVSAALGPCLGAETMRMNEAEEGTFGSFGVTDKVVWESS